MDTKALIKTDDEIATMRKGCQILASVFDRLESRIVPGACAFDLDHFAEHEIRVANCIPAFKDFDAGGPMPFPGSMCFSLNHEIVHGIPTKEKVISKSDLVKIDMGLIYKGYYADMARTFVMPEASEEAKNLALHTKKTFEAGIKNIRDGAKLSDFAQVAQDYAENGGYGVVRGLVGHGIGRELHMPPQVPNYFSKEFDNFTFRKGMTIAIEPMVNIGTSDIAQAADGWTIITADHKLSAHYENTILVTNEGCEILTKIT